MHISIIGVIVTVSAFFSGTAFGALNTQQISLARRRAPRLKVGETCLEGTQCVTLVCETISPTKVKKCAPALCKFRTNQCRMDIGARRPINQSKHDLKHHLTEMTCEEIEKAEAAIKSDKKMQQRYEAKRVRPAAGRTCPECGQTFTRAAQTKLHQERFAHWGPDNGGSNQAASSSSTIPSSSSASQPPNTSLSPSTGASAGQDAAQSAGMLALQDVHRSRPRPAHNIALYPSCGWVHATDSTKWGWTPLKCPMSTVCQQRWPYEYLNRNYYMTHQCLPLPEWIR